MSKLLYYDEVGENNNDIVNLTITRAFTTNKRQTEEI